MKKVLVFIIACIGLYCHVESVIAEHRVEPIPFGDFEQWAVRYIKESGIIGGKTQTIYAIAPTDTIRTNEPFIYGVGGNPWSVSNAYAKVSGVEKASGTTIPEKRGNGTCCRMNVELADVTALGIINLHVLVNGTIFTGKTIEPIRTSKDPYQNIDFGVPFTKKPSALIFDYKAIISPEHSITVAKGFGGVKKREGHDEAEVYVLLQKRWEDAEGNIYSARIGTGYQRFDKTQKEWVNGYELPIYYGDITGKPFYRDYMGFVKECRAMNSKGKIVPINEVRWGDAKEEPTHVIIMLTSGCYEAFVGREGNVFWVDNIGFVYE